MLYLKVSWGVTNARLGEVNRGTAPRGQKRLGPIAGATPMSFKASAQGPPSLSSWGQEDFTSAGCLGY